MWGAPAAASELAAELLKTSIQESIHSFSHGCCAAAVKDVDSHLIESHEGPHSHTTGDEDLHAILGQVIDRGHASALLMGNVGQSCNLLHLAVGDFYHECKGRSGRNVRQGGLRARPDGSREWQRLYCSRYAPLDASQNDVYSFAAEPHCCSILQIQLLNE